MAVDHTRNENTSKLHLFPDLEAKKLDEPLVRGSVVLVGKRQTH